MEVRSPKPQSLDAYIPDVPNPVNEFVDYVIRVYDSGRAGFNNKAISGGRPIEIAYFGTCRLRAYRYDTGLYKYGSKITPDFTTFSGTAGTFDMVGLVTDVVYRMEGKVFSSTANVDDSQWFYLFDFMVPTPGGDYDVNKGDPSPFP